MIDRKHHRKRTKKLPQLTEELLVDGDCHMLTVQGTQDQRPAEHPIVETSGIKGVRKLYGHNMTQLPTICFRFPWQKNKNIGYLHFDQSLQQTESIKETMSWHEIHQRDSTL